MSEIAATFSQPIDQQFAAGFCDADTPTVQFRIRSVTSEPALTSRHPPAVVIIDDTHDEQLDTDSLYLAVNSEKSFTDIITDMAAQLDMKGARNVINVDRDNVLDGGLRGFQKKGFDAHRLLSVRFTGEDGIDNGGLTKEFLRLLLSAISALPIFCGPVNAKNMALDYNALVKRTYETVGRVFAFTIVHGGPLPTFFSPSLYTAIAEGYAAVKCEIKDVPDVALQVKLQQVLQVTTDNEYADALDSMLENVERAGCLSFHKVADKQLLVDSICHFEVIGHCAMAIDQLKTGLSSLGVLKSIEENAVVMRQGFIHAQCILDASTVDVIFTNIQWSTKGSNRYKKEKTTITHWHDLLQDLEESQKLEQLMVYATGLSSIPALGFTPEPTIAFKHCEDCAPDDIAKDYPFANTCTNTLILPVLSSYDQFTENVTVAITMATTFTDK